MKAIREAILRYRNVCTVGALFVVLVASVVLMVSRSVESEEASEVVAQEPTVVTGTVCVDAGHGGSDTGAVSPDGSSFEKDENLQLALKVREYLEGMGFEVIMTRTDDSTVELNERCSIANSYGADLFVSLHRNSSEDTSASGVEVWVHSSKPPVDVALASRILDALQSVGVQEDRGIGYGYRGDSSEDYRINRLTTMPSCLVETGFISNEVDGELYSTHLDAYAEAIAGAVYQTFKDASDGLVDTSRGKAGQNWDGFQ